MTELVTAVFEAPSTADAAIHDLEMARIPSVVIQRGVSGDQDGGTSTWHSVAGAWHNKRSRDWPSVTVAVDEIQRDPCCGNSESARAARTRRAYGPKPPALRGEVRAGLQRREF